MRKRIIFLTAFMASAFLLQAQDSTKKEAPFHDIFISGSYYHLNDGFQYGMGVAGGFYKRIYAETRWNYEDLHTLSVLGGYSFGNDEHAFEWKLVPMIGFSVGNTDAFIPALETYFGYKKFELYSENEYTISTSSGKEDNFFYSWSELTYKAIKWLKAGTVAQRRRVHQTDREVDRGFMASINFLPKAVLNTYLFDPFDPDRIFFVLGLRINF